jgi:hypothetical protein
MISEIYRIQATANGELADLIQDGENILLREQLGLAPVLRKEENAKPFVFRKMTDEEHKVFKLLFPNDTKIESYDEFIPSDVLEALKEFNETCPYKISSSGVRVWHAKEYDPDPVLVCGVRTVDDAYDFENAKILIARWGDALPPFETLKEKALAKWKAVRRVSLRKIARDVAAAEETLDALEDILDIETPVVYHV